MAFSNVGFSSVTKRTPRFWEFRLRPTRSRWTHKTHKTHNVHHAHKVFAFLAILIVIPMLAGTASADTGWVRGNIKLNLRSGAGTQFKITGSVETGDEMSILSRGENWTRVRTSEGKTGWIPAGYLETEPPPTLRLAQLESETTTLRSELEKIRSEASKLRESNATLASTDSGQREEIETLKIENFELLSGSRSQEWITGALILVGGMLLGAFLHRNSTRRPSSRIRL
jgi:SH3 domain protein